MPTISRTGSDRVVTRAPGADGEPPVAPPLPGGGDCEAGETAALPGARLEAEPGAIIVYNRQAGAMRLIGSHEAPPARVLIEFRRNTKVYRACWPATGGSGRQKRWH